MRVKSLDHRIDMKSNICAFAILFFLCRLSVAQSKQPAVSLQEGQLVYAQDTLGNRVPDFSYAGYKSSEESIPQVATQVWVSWKAGDQTARIQKALDHVSNLPLKANGFRGAVLLESGIYEIAGGLVIRESGVVLRGSGSHDSGTVLLGTGKVRETLIRVVGENDAILSDGADVMNDYVPVGAMTLQVNQVEAFKTGDLVRISRPATQEWISALQMEDFGGQTGYIGWKPGERNVQWDRVITRISGNEVTIDVPITTALDKSFGGGTIHRVSWQGRIENVGIEHLKLESTYDKSNLKDEQHRWMAITFEHVRDAWVRQANFQHFAGSAVAIWNTASRITVEDCKSLDPVSEIAGQRRYTFFTEGQQCLFQRIYSEYGYHDFATGFMAAGPNAFVECQSVLPHSFSGAIDSWSSGTLFDIVNVDGGALRYSNRGMEAQGAGWTAANSMFWQCTAALVDCPAPPTAMNWAVAVWAQFSGDGYWHEANGFIKPRSLFYGQLADRIGHKVLDRARLLPLTTEASSSPTLEQAAAYAAESYNPKPQLKDWIDAARLQNPVVTERGGARDVDEIKPIRTSEVKPTGRALAVRNGHLVFGDVLATGARQTVQWWRGNVRPYDASKAGEHATRYVPGRIGKGHTDDLKEMTDALKARNVTILDHNYGLWYDRRRDDHERIRRMNGEVWAPFYELPFARSGEGFAWDGLSKYDLTKYNDWYWRRLSEFTGLAEEKELVLFHQNYFQHNILEAGGHYADFPWRTANNVNDTPFPEPVFYAGDKRIFMAEQFYDVSEPAYRQLHESYIRQCLNNFDDRNNVIQFISAEYTGPLSFIEFWLDVIKDWQQETGKEVLVALSATKDVQDAILSDSVRAPLVDVIDIRYWWYGVEDQDSITLYAPEGGKSLAPRQHARLVKTPKETFHSTYRAVLEYSQRYPEKAILHNTQRSSAFGWAVFMGGGSLMDIPKISDERFLRDAIGMGAYTSTVSAYLMRDVQSGSQIIYPKKSGQIGVDLTSYRGAFEVFIVNARTGEAMAKRQNLAGKQKYSFEISDGDILWVHRK